MDSSKTKVLATESNTFKRRIKEAIEIRLRNPSLHRENGFELARIYDTIVLLSFVVILCSHFLFTDNIHHLIPGLVPVPVISSLTRDS